MEDSKKNEYYFGGIKEFNLEQIETEVLNESVYLDVFAGSDMRLKTDVADMGPTLNSLLQLDTVTYKWNQEVPEHLKSEGTQVGLVAQQVAEVFPELVRKDEASGYLTVNYQKLTTHLLVALKELNGKVEQQSLRIAQLERQ